MILIVGAGPIGIEMAIELSRCNVSYRIVEAGATASTIEWYAPGTEIFSSPERLAIAGIPFEPQTRKAFREDYLLYLRNVVRQFRLPIEHYRRVVKIDKCLDGTFEVAIAPSDHGVGGPLEQGFDGSKSDAVETIKVDSVILAIGNLHVPTTSDIPGEELSWVSHYMGEPHRYAGTRVMILGSGNSAAEATIRLYHVGAKVTLGHRGQGFRPKKVKPWLSPELDNLTKEGKIVVVNNFAIIKIARGVVHGASAGEALKIDADFVLLLTGYKQKTDLFDQLGVELIDAQPVLDMDTMQTSVPGIYIIGTAAAGTEAGGVKTFVENAHVHVTRVLQALELIERAPVAADRPVDEREI